MRATSSYKTGQLRCFTPPLLAFPATVHQSTSDTKSTQRRRSGKHGTGPARLQLREETLTQNTVTITWDALIRSHVSHKVYNPCIQERHVKHFVLIRTLQGFQALLAAEKGKTLGMVKTHMLQDF